jgi:hypothetical protein
VSGVADRTPAAQNITSLFTGARIYVMRPLGLGIVAADAAFAGIAIRFMAAGLHKS